MTGKVKAILHGSIIQSLHSQTGMSTSLIITKDMKIACISMINRREENGMI